MLATLFKRSFLILIACTLSACNILEDETDEQQKPAAVEELVPRNTEKIESPENLKGFSYAPGTGYAKPDAFVLYTNGSISKAVTFEKDRSRSVVITGNGIVAKKEGPKVRVTFDGEEIAVIQFKKMKEVKKVDIPGTKTAGVLALEFTNDYFDEVKKIDRNMEFISVDVISK